MASKPAILTVDDDTDVLASIRHDLRRRYNEKYRILDAPSGTAALDLLKKLIQRDDAVALLLVDYRMPQMDGLDTLSQAVKLYPDAKRVLLTAYADTDAAIRAINQVHLDHYLLKPWHPPEQNLYPILDDLLDDWYSCYKPHYDRVRLLGTRWSPPSYEMRDFLARNMVPYDFLDVEEADRRPDVRRHLETLGHTPQIPVLFFENGSVMERPTTDEVAGKLGLRTRACAEYYDVAVIGAGPAGLAASVYGSSEGLKTVLVEREAPGGQAGQSSRIENYLGFPTGVAGWQLAQRAVTQARRFGVEIVSPQAATAIQLEGPYRQITLGNGSKISCHALVLALGVQWRKLGVPGEEKLQGAGVYYGGSITEAFSCQNEEVYIVGGANSAGQAAVYFSKYARRVVMLVRGASLSASMSQYLIDQIAQTGNIQVECQTRVVAVHGEGHLERITIACDQGGTTEDVPASSLYIFIGAEPNTAWLNGSITRDPKGFILTGPDLIHDGKRPKGWGLDRDPGLLETSVPGVFAVGDVRHGSIKRVASSVGEGSIAIQFVHQYLSNL